MFQRGRFCGSSPLGVDRIWVLSLELQTGEEGEGPRKDHRRPKGLELQARERRERKGLHLRTEEGTGQVGPQARKRKRGGWDPGLSKVTEEREGNRLRAGAGSRSSRKGTEGRGTQSRQRREGSGSPSCEEGVKPESGREFPHPEKRRGAGAPG